MIGIDGAILENRYTTAQWAATTTILGNRVLGYETDGSGNPIGFKMGDGINLWAVLPYWSFADSPVYDVIPTGSTLTSGYFDITYSPYASHGNNPDISVNLIVSATTVHKIYDVQVDEISVAGVLTTLRVYCHVDPADPTKSIDNIEVCIR